MPETTRRRISTSHNIVCIELPCDTGNYPPELRIRRLMPAHSDPIHYALDALGPVHEVRCDKGHVQRGYFRSGIGYTAHIDADWLTVDIQSYKSEISTFSPFAVRLGQTEVHAPEHGHWKTGPVRAVARNLVSARIAFTVLDRQNSGVWSYFNPNFLKTTRISSATKQLRVFGIIDGRAGSNGRLGEFGGYGSGYLLGNRDDDENCRENAQSNRSCWLNNSTLDNFRRRFRKRTIMLCHENPTAYSGARLLFPWVFGRPQRRSSGSTHPSTRRAPDFYHQKPDRAGR